MSTTMDAAAPIPNSETPVDIDALTRTIASLQSEVLALRQENEQQREQIRIMRAREYGRKSEKRTVEDIRQGRLFDEAELHAAESAEAPIMEQVRIRKTVYSRRKPGRKPISAKLARVEVVVDLTEEEKRVEEGFELVRIGEETSEQVHEIPQKYVVIRTVRPKYAVKSRTGNIASAQDGKGPIRVASAPACILPRSIATPSLLASVLTGKFCDALPFYRQERMFLRFGLEISRQDMANWAIAVASRVDGYLAILERELLAGSFIHSDETFFQVMGDDGRTTGSKSYMWVLTGGAENRRVVLYRYHAKREGAFISNLLANYTGYLQTDGYAGYNAIGEKDGIIHVGCWAHVRRYFVEAHEAAMKKGAAIEAIEKIGRLYDEERSLRQKFFGDGGTQDRAAFVEKRRTAVLPIFEDIRSWLKAKSAETNPTSALGKAVSYTLGQWSLLVRYIECADLTPDNNEAERAIRPFTVGRNNWVISGGPRGAQASATLYSLIETFKLNGLDPYYALRYLLTKLPVISDEELEAILPWNLRPEELHELVVEDARISLASIPID